MANHIWDLLNTEDEDSKNEKMKTCDNGYNMTLNVKQNHKKKGIFEMYRETLVGQCSVHSFPHAIEKIHYIPN